MKQERPETRSTSESVAIAAAVPLANGRRLIGPNSACLNQSSRGPTDALWAQ